MTDAQMERPKISRPPGCFLDVNGAFIRRIELSFGNLEWTNLVDADATGAIFRGANFKDALLTGTILRGADLRDAKHLTVGQLAEAIIDDETLLPDYLSREELLRHRARGAV